MRTSTTPQQPGIAVRRPHRGRILTGTAAAVCLVAALVGAPVASAAPVAPASPTTDVGLYGAANPTFDGVLRQSYALLGLAAIGRTAPADALAWLTAQQCANGAFQAYVAPGQTCTAPSASTYTGPDVNSTAVAAMALHAHGRTARAERAIRWLLREQDSTGGWEWIDGLAPDPVSTGLALQALRSGVLPAGETARAIRRGDAFIAARILACPAPRDTRGGVPFAAGSDPDGFTAVTALLGLVGAPPVAPTAQRGAAPTLDCGTSATPAGSIARYLIRNITVGDGLIPSAFAPGSADYNATAQAVLALVGSGFGKSAITRAVGALGRSVRAYVGSGDAASPAALGTLLLVAHATEQSATAFGPGKVNLVKHLAATKRR
jgi:hypothetical protein